MSAGKNLEIEYLRAAAVLMTFFGHLPFILPFQYRELSKVFKLVGMWSGVDLFFCISGYVVSKSFIDFLDKHKAAGDFWLAAQCFWIRRLYRLTPSAWLWLAICILGSIFFNSSGIFSSFESNFRSATAVVTISGNLAHQYGFILGNNGVYWSLALEEQFYLLFPLFLLVALGAWRWRVLLLLIAVQFLLDRNPGGNSFNSMGWFFRLDALMWGILIYFFSKSSAYRLFEPTFLKNAKIKTFVINLLLIYLLGAITVQLIAMPIAVGLIALVSALLVLLASYQSGYIWSVPLLSPVLAWTGSRSYAIYLLHIPVFSISSEAWTRYAAYVNHPVDATYTWPILLSTTLATALLAELNFRLVEDPLRKVGVEIAARRLRMFGRADRVEQSSRPVY